MTPALKFIERIKLNRRVELIELAREFVVEEDELERYLRFVQLHR